MKKYIILGWCGGMGGGNIYTRNQCVVARKFGWEPIVIHSSKKDTFILDLKPFDRNRIVELELPPCYFTLRERKAIFEKIMSIISPEDGDVFFIESNGVRYSYWGEMVAKRLNCKHFAFLVEAYFALNDNYFEFYEFKLRRGELAGTRPASLPMLFKPYRVLSEQENKYLAAYCTNSVEDVPDTLNVDYSRYDFVIGNIGRSTKPYVLQVAKDLAEYARSHPDKKMLFLIVGGEIGSYEESVIKRSLGENKNIDLLSTGFMFPIPKALLAHIDVAIATSGCIRPALEANIPTIAYKDNELQPYGVCGYEVHSPLPERPSNPRSLGTILDSILFLNYCQQNEFTPYYNFRSDDESWARLERDTNYMMTTPDRLEFFDTVKVYPRSRVRKLYIKTLGRVLPFHLIVESLSWIRSLKSR